MSPGQGELIIPRFHYGEVCKLLILRRKSLAKQTFNKCDIWSNLHWRHGISAPVKSGAIFAGESRGR